MKYFLSTFIFLAISLVAFGSIGTLTGPATSTVGSTDTYTYTNGAIVIGGAFSITNGNYSEDFAGGTYTYYASVTWANSGTTTVAFKDGSGNILKSMTVTVASGTAPAVPATTFGVVNNCGNTVVTRNTNPGTGIAWYWQTTSTGFSLSNSASTFTQTTTGALYLRAMFTATNVWSTTAQSVGTITVNLIPGSPTGFTAVSVCKFASATLTATPGSNGNGIQWFNSRWAYVATTNSLVLTNQIAPTTYYVKSYNTATTCLSTAYLTVSISTTPPPVASISTSCSGANTPNVIFSFSGTAPYNLTYSNGSTPTTVNGISSSSYTLTNPAPGTYSITSLQDATGCNAVTLGSPVAVSTAPTASVSGGGSFCDGSTAPSIIFTFTGAAPFTFQYNTGLTIRTVNSYPGSTYTITNPAAGTYSVTSLNDNAGCHGTSLGTSVNETIKFLPPSPIDATINWIYGSGTAQLTAIAAATGDNLNWYTQVTGGTSISSGANYTTPSLTSTTVYYADETNTTTGCVSPRTPITANVFPFVNTNSLKEEVVRVSGITQEVQLYPLPTSQKTTKVSFVDGLMRASQIQVMQSSPSAKDVVQQVQYDQFGRTSKSYLPYTNTTYNGSYSATTGTDQLAFYNNSTDKVADDAFPFAIATYENSPMGRLTEQGGVGTVWQNGGGHTTKVVYSYNITGEVRNFNSDGSSTTFFAANLLDRTEVTNLNGFKTVTYSRMGQTVMKKSQIDKTIDGVSLDYLETYYIYDDAGRVIYVIQPKGIAALKLNTWSLTQTIKDQFVFEFVYDKRSRLTQKKVPGAGWTYIVYDQLNRPVLSQDNNIRSANQWLFIKYDGKGRAIITGLYTDAVNTTLAAMQAVLDGKNYDKVNPDLYYEVRQAATTYGYSNQVFPTTNTQILGVNYYDDYDFDFNGTADWSYTSQGLTGEGIQGPSVNRATGSKKLVMGTSNWLYSYAFYDRSGRVIQTRSNNHLSLTVDNLNTMVYDFEGKATLTKSYHNAGGTNQTTVTRRPVYDFAGRVLQLFQTVNATAEVLVAQYEYNELGQVVDKKLHSTDLGGTFIQSVDYRFNIQGWLTSINNSQLNVDSKNDETNDYFGMEFLYNTTETGLNDQTNDKVYYNGGISAVKWKGPGAAANLVGQRSYKYSYDESDNLVAATFQANNGSWTAEAGTLNESMTYDHNGNIYTLQRSQNQRGLNGASATSTAQTIDNLSYTYAAGNVLSKVDDGSGNSAGFTDGIQATTEYTYDASGNVLTDQNKKISGLTYNYLGKAQQVNFQDGRYQTYTYDATGNKLEMKTYSTTGVLVTTTDYVNGFVYENNTLTFFSSPEGRIVNNGTALEYQYAIMDHQGNTRVVFSSATPTPQITTATFEASAQGSEITQFQNYPSGSGINPVNTNNHTPGGTSSQYLNGGVNGQIGVAKSYKVFAGDQLKIEAYGRYNTASANPNTALSSFATNLLLAFSLPPPLTGETGTPSSGIKSWGNIAGGGFGDGSTDNTDVKAFVNIILFDKNYNFLDVAFAQVTSTGTPGYLSASYTAKEAGYAFLYISNEHPTFADVYFDDVKMTYTPGNIVQYNEYYPFGMQTQESWTRDNSKNNFLGNGGSEMNANSGWYETFYRGYDPALGRFHQVDPKATMMAGFTPYNYAGNNPAMFNDPNGDRLKVPPSVDDTGGGGGGMDVDWIFAMMWAADAMNAEDIRPGARPGKVFGDYSTYTNEELIAAGAAGSGQAANAYANRLGQTLYQSGLGQSLGGFDIQNGGVRGLWIDNNIQKVNSYGSGWEIVGQRSTYLSFGANQGNSDYAVDQTVESTLRYLNKQSAGFTMTGDQLAERSSKLSLASKAIKSIEKVSNGLKFNFTFSGRMLLGAAPGISIPNGTVFSFTDTTLANNTIALMMTSAGATLDNNPFLLYIQGDTKSKDGVTFKSF